MKVSQKKADRIFFDSLCDGAEYLAGAGILINPADKEAYNKVKEKKKGAANLFSYEDFYMAYFIEGGELKMIDIEENYPEEIAIGTLTYKELKERFKKVPDELCQKVLDETYDAEVASMILQYLFLGEHRFG